MTRFDTTVKKLNFTQVLDIAAVLTERDLTRANHTEVTEGCIIERIYKTNPEVLK